MKLTALEIDGAYVIEGEPAADERGSFVRIYDASEFADAGLVTAWPQVSVSTSRRAGTLRGMHWQAAPQEEVKLVYCTRGAVYDVVLDVPRRRWVAVELQAGDNRALYVPAGCAHGFQTLVADTEVLYMISAVYEPGLARGARWDDPAFAIVWPPAPSGGRTISARDRAFPLT